MQWSAIIQLKNKGWIRMLRSMKQIESDKVKIARTAGKALGSIPFTDLGSNINCMNSEQKAREYLKGGEKAIQIPSERSFKPKGEK